MSSKVFIPFEQHRGSRLLDSDRLQHAFDHAHTPEQAAAILARAVERLDVLRVREAAAPNFYHPGERQQGAA